MSVEKRMRATSGWPMLAVVLLEYLASGGLMALAIMRLVATDEAGASPVPGISILFCSVAVLVVAIITNRGLFSLQPGQARVCVLFGKYVGTVREEGLRFANPFYSRTLGMAGEGEGIDPTDENAAKLAFSQRQHSSKISTRARTYNGERIKVNDKMGNPIEIATVVVWRVADTAKALFDVDDYESFVAMVTETALRHVASAYAYDHMEDDDASSRTITLRTNIEEVSEALMSELDRKLAVAGVEVDDARLTHLAYAPEIAQAMLRRQQAEAIIAARKKIVEGAVGMVDMAVEMLTEGGTIDLDDERKATMATNLMVVLCGESEAQPVLNTGTLYN